MKDSSLSSLSPLDGRYSIKVKELQAFFSEFALMHYRLRVEISYLLFLAEKKVIPKLSANDKIYLTDLIANFNLQEAQKVKKIEAKIFHDIKSIEYYLQEKCRGKIDWIIPFIHFGLTSDDINSVAYALAVRDARTEILLPILSKIIVQLCAMAEKESKSVMLARTHGQPAVPTTMGKELVVFAQRLYSQCLLFSKLPIEAKFSGAVGNFNAHVASQPKVDWEAFSKEFISSFGLKPNCVTTQIIPGDSFTRLFQHLALLNSILIGFNQDMWRYISDDYITLKKRKEQVGSSTMPQKVNPIDFENSEGNLALANSLLSFLSEKLPISRLQRDLSDSTVKRSIGTAFGYCLLAYKSLSSGLDKLSVNRIKLREDLDAHWEVVAEGIQTVLRSEGEEKSYEKLKDFARGKRLSQTDLQSFIEQLSVSSAVKMRLLSLTPFSYIGLADKIAEKAARSIQIKNLK